MGDFDLNEIQQSISPKKEKKSSKAFFKKLFSIVLVVFSLLTVGFVTNYIFSLKYRNREEVVDIGYIEQESIVLFTIADELKYFDLTGTAVNIRKFENQDDLIKAWNKGRLDLLVLEDIGFVININSFKSSRVISTVARYDAYEYIVDLKKSIYKVTDLDSKTIGVETNDNNSFWLDTGLQRSGVNRESITILHVKPKDLGEQLANGYIDAVFAKNLEAYNAQQFSNTELQALALSAQGGEKANALLVATNSYIEDNNKEINQVLTSLVMAKDYYDNNKDTVSNILIAKWSVEKGYVNNITKNYQYDLVLDSKLTELMISEVNWVGSKRKVKEVVDIQQLINYNFLRKIKPENVSF